MKIDPFASWGYPVLRSAVDDYVRSEFQSSIHLEILEDKTTIILNYEILISVPEIIELINLKKAKVIIYTHCRDTWFGEIHDASELSGNFLLNKNLIEGATEFSTFVIAAENLKKYRSLKFHPEYQDITFDIEQNQIIAIADPLTEHITRDMQRNAAGLFDYAYNQNLSQGEWKVILTENRLKIQANENQIRYFRRGENTPQGRAVLLNAVFLPALIQVISNFQDEPDEYLDFGWAASIQAKIDRLSKKNMDALGIAQELLKVPATLLNRNMKWNYDEA